MPARLPLHYNVNSTCAFCVTIKYLASFPECLCECMHANRPSPPSQRLLALMQDDCMWHELLLTKTSGRLAASKQ